MEQSLRMLRREPDNWFGFHNPFTVAQAEAVRRYHRSFPEYAPTPLHRLSTLSERLGVRDIYVKDESPRFGLNAFKVLGGSYSIGCALAERFGLEELSFGALTRPELAEKLRNICLVTATDGNHGRGVAWTAQRLGCRSVVYLPKGSAPERLENIRKLGADASITEMNYDDTVRYARAQAEEHGWILIQDTSWDGYEDIPRRIMQGYTTIGSEILEQLGGARPTHIFLQAGVGAMAAAIAGYFADAYADAPPKFVIVEPENANCFYRSAEENALCKVGGALATIMAGLACGEPCTLAWELLRRRVEYFISARDSVAATGMRVLGNPLGNDPHIISGESGASTLGCAYALLNDAELQHLRDALGLDADSRLLFISTEGDTDRKNYRRIVWDGAYPAAN